MKKAMTKSFYHLGKCHGRAKAEWSKGF
jgi:hypothetical protein